MEEGQPQLRKVVSAVATELGFLEILELPNYGLFTKTVVTPPTRKRRFLLHRVLGLRHLVS